MVLCLFTNAFDEKEHSLISLYKKRTIGESLTDAYKFYKENFKSIFIVLTVLTVPLSIAYIAVTMALETGTASGTEIIIVFTTFFIFLILSVFQNFISPYIIKHYIDNENKIIVSKLIKGFLNRFFSFLGLTLIYYAFFFAMFLGIGFISILLAQIPALIIVAAFGIFAFLIYMFVRFVYVFHIYTIERIAIGSAFSKATKVIKGHWWETFFILLIIVIVYISILSVFMGVAGIFIGFENIMTESAGKINIVFILIYYIVNLILSVMLYPFAQMSITMHYLNIIERSESKSVLGLVDKFGEDEPNE